MGFAHFCLTNTHHSETAGPPTAAHVLVPESCILTMWICNIYIYNIYIIYNYIYIYMSIAYKWAIVWVYGLSGIPTPFLLMATCSVSNHSLQLWLMAETHSAKNDKVAAQNSHVFKYVISPFIVYIYNIIYVDMGQNPIPLLFTSK